MKRVAIGLSGGVDSAVSALLLKNQIHRFGGQGYDVVGVHLYCWPPRSEIENGQLKIDNYEERRREWVKKNGCRADEDRAMALKSALEIGIPFRVLDFSEEYNKRVVDYFYREYEAGRTPNPDILCNSEIKFGLFLDWALENDFDYVATGHYAKLKIDNGQWRMKIPKDKHKDQTYFLWKLTQKELTHVLFPLSDLLKSEVRKIARDAGLSVANRPDSQGICFIGNVDARKFLARRLKEKKGEVKNIDGEVIGTHKGVWFYTIGQRGGWELTAKAQRKYARDDKTPIFYVVGKNAEKNELVVGTAMEAMGNKFKIVDTNLSSDAVSECHVRIRHGGKLIPATLQANEVVLSEPQRGIASGQSAVFYSEDGEVLGGGVIE